MKNKINSFPLLFLISILFYGCYGTRTITFNDKAISKKESILLYQNENVFELLNFKFDGNVLSGTLFNSSFPDLPKSRKVKWLEVYIEPDFYLPIKDDNNNLVRIPYASIYKIDFSFNKL